MTAGCHIPLFFSPYPHRSPKPQKELMRPSEKTAEPSLFSMTENNDLLSQWRGYGGKLSSYCLGLDLRMYNDFLKGLFLEKCIYNLKEKDLIIQAFIDNMIKQCQDNPNSIYTIGFLAYWVYTFCASIYKNEAFKEENEWRLLTFDDDITKWSFKNGGTTLIPYKPVKINIGSVIKSITIGPCEDFEKKELSLKYFLSQNEINFAIINRSNIPFRQI
jgi:hypothetical protein